MKQATICVLVLLCVLPARAEEAPADTPERAAGKVLAALDEGAPETLAELAARDAPDPWLVVNELLFRGEADAAAAFAGAAPRKDTEQLPAYVAAQRGEKPDREARETYVVARAAMESGDAKAALDALGTSPAPGREVITIRTGYVRGVALAALGRHADSVEAFLRTVDQAVQVGWWSAACTTLEAGGDRALRRSDLPTAIACWTRRLEIETSRGSRGGIAASRLGIGTARWRGGELPAAMQSLEQALALFREVGDRAGMAQAIGGIGNVHGARSELRKALDCYEESVRLREDLGDREGVAGMLGNMGNIHLRLGDVEQAQKCQERALALCEEMADRRGVVRTLSNLGNLHYMRGDYQKALELYERSLALQEEVGDRTSVGQTLTNLGQVCMDLGDLTRAKDLLQRSLAIREEEGNRKGVAFVVGTLGLLHFRLGDYPAALSMYERSLALCEAIGDREGVGWTLGVIGDVRLARGDVAAALSFYERALEIHEALGARIAAARMVIKVGKSQMTRGDYPRALAVLQRALALTEELSDLSGTAVALSRIGWTYALLGDYVRARAYTKRALAVAEKLRSPTLVAGELYGLADISRCMGDYATALRLHERALRMREELGERRGVAYSLSGMGTVYYRIGDLQTARAYLARSLEMFEALESVSGVADALGTLGVVHKALGDLPEALSCQRRTLKLCERVDNRGGAAAALSNIATIHLKLGEFQEALASQERALEINEALGNRAGVASGLEHLGAIQKAIGNREEALRLFERGLREARRIRSRDLEVYLCTHLARLRLEMGQDARALMSAQRAVRELEHVLGGLSEEGGASARESYREVYEVGSLAAARLEDAGEMLAFLESGRAGSLLEGLHGGWAARFADLPEELVTAEATARAEETRAQQVYARALGGNDIREVRRAARAVDEATARRREVAARIQREAKRVAGLFYPRAATLEEIEGWLPDGTALVSYALSLDEALALVLTNQGERIVDLGDRAAVEGAAGALDLTQPGEDPQERLDELRRLLVEPLGLGNETRTVLVSPEGPLCYVPFGALFARTKRAVAVVPSGTTYVLLREEERRRGEHVLALGDPDYRQMGRTATDVYRGRARLRQLPASKAEATAVGDVVLLGAEATEDGLRKALAERKRWRAVHLACHGLVDTERPTLSSLALTPSGEEDGFLTALEILRMDIPADLAVLSACETSKGKLAKGEGVVGVARAFMYAGAPRVLCSLWKVDDEATSALMKQFYASWNPRDGSAGVPAAEALRRAQAHVRGQEKWAHPHYWAAWVLWGLAE